MDTAELIIDTPEAGIATFVLNRPAELNAWTYSAAGDLAVSCDILGGAR